MKQLFALLTLFIPGLLAAQEDARYLTGAVPEENGKVVFTKELNAPELSADAVYERMLEWANGFFKDENNRVVYSDKKQGDIAAIGQTMLVFQSTALSLDQSEMNYRVTMKCDDSNCLLKVSGIRYIYNVSYQKEPDKYIAEEWITDKYCLNKKKNKLNRGMGKFRRKTIDFIDELFASASVALGATESATAPAVTIAEPQKPVPAYRPVQTKESYVAFSADKIPSTLLQMLPESEMQVAAADKSEAIENRLADKHKAKETQAAWKGTGNLFGKSIVSISISRTSEVYKTIGENGIYSLSFFKKGESGDAWLIIDCRKQGETEEEGDMVTVIGEILNVWVK